MTRLLTRIVVPLCRHVAVNRDITPKSTYTAVTLSEGDKVEIVRPMGGG